jgi:acyl-CoA synthetase (AMP-forming)/AMP-acid ligase II
VNRAADLAAAARRWPTSPAIARGTRVVHDYATFARRVAALADSMQSAGLAHGDRVALVSRNGVAYLEALYACWWAGLCAVPVNAKLHPAELDYVLGDAGVRAAFVDEAWAVALGGANATCASSSSAARTTGAGSTTARPAKRPPPRTTRRRGSSTRAAPPAARRASCCRTATSRR